MNTRLQAAILPGGRLHLHDGPIDLIIAADGVPENVRAAYAAATRRFATVLDKLCEELPLLREKMRTDAPMPNSPVARRMDRAVRPLCDTRFITRMAAVAGSVADEILAEMVAAAPLTRAWVNNGGDIAVHLSVGAVFYVGMVSGSVSQGRDAASKPPTPPSWGRARKGGLDTAARPLPSPPPRSLRERPSPQGGGCSAPHPNLFGTLRLTHADPIRGIATSGFGGRSFSLGIADAVTILAADAARADAAATLVANAVDLPGHPAIARTPAHDLDPQSDLGARLVTRSIGALTSDEIAAALEAGLREAERLSRAGHIAGAALSLRGAVRTLGAAAPSLRSEQALSHAV